jgi:hypothetical protein
VVVQPGVSISRRAKLFELKLETAKTAFKIGVLAGAIFAGCSKEQVKGLSEAWRFHSPRTTG